jgi:two-component system KDP operon response regulator KdpE
MSQRQTALIVDDDQGVAENLATALRRAGIIAHTARNGLHGYSRYFREPTDWVVTDIDMPELNGIDMMRSIRVINPTVKTIYISGSIEKYRAALIRESHQFAAQILPKPFDLRQLIERISESDLNRSPGATVPSKDLHNCTEMPSDEAMQRAKK